MENYAKDKVEEQGVAIAWVGWGCFGLTRTRLTLIEPE